MTTEVDFSEALMQIDPDEMSKYIFDIPYSILKKSIYPTPSYKTFLIAKRNGSQRVINEPRLDVKNLQDKLLVYLYKKAHHVKKCVHGFTKNRSIYTNALQHCSPKTYHLLNIDIENFFPSITFYRIRGLFMSGPFNFSYQVATILAQLCCYKNSLPQGAPTSPILANLICRSLDKELMTLAKRHRAIYTRYCDDITFSFSIQHASRLPKSICIYDGSELILGDEIQQIFSNNSFEINKSKTRISNPRQRLEVTGLTINKFPNVKREYIDQIRGALNAWKKHGYANAQESFSKRAYKRRTRTGNLPSLSRYVWGKLLHLKMVRGEDDVIYTRLAEEYNRLSMKEKNNKNFILTTLPVKLIVRNQDDSERAVFVVECSADHPKDKAIVSQGTAFAFGDVGFVTCEHVLRYKNDYFDSLPNGQISILNAKTKKKWKTRVIHKDDRYDLAILEVVDPNPPECRVFSAVDTAINIGEKGFVIGFPNYSYGRLKPNHSETKVINRFNRTALARLEIGEAIRKGNSGGPFVDSLYRLSGVVQQGATIDSSNNECLCVTELQSWIAKYKNDLILERKELIILLRNQLLGLLNKIT